MRAGIREVAVVVPAHDEEASITACINSIRNAGKALHDEVAQRVRFRIIVALDACRDATADLVVAEDVDVVALSARCVGLARAAGSELAQSLSRVDPHQLWFANTDADSQVPVDWLIHMVRLADAGADLVLGTAIPERTAASARLLSRWHSLHALHEGHPYVHGANFGIRAQVYSSLGGWAPIPTGEDVDLATRASKAATEIKRTAQIPVRTSARLRGRAPNGYAQYLRSLLEPDCPPARSAVVDH